MVRRMQGTLRVAHLVVGAILLFFAFFPEPMAGRWPGPMSNLGLFALFGGVLIYAAVSLARPGKRA